MLTRQFPCPPINCILFAVPSPNSTSPVIPMPWGVVSNFLIPVLLSSTFPVEPSQNIYVVSEPPPSSAFIWISPSVTFCSILNNPVLFFINESVPSWYISKSFPVPNLALASSIKSIPLLVLLTDIL